MLSATLCFAMDGCALAIPVTNFATGKLISGTEYRPPGHRYNGGCVLAGCVYIQGGHAKYGDDKFSADLLIANDARDGLLFLDRTATDAYGETYHAWMGRQIETVRATRYEWWRDEAFLAQFE